MAALLSGAIVAWAQRPRPRLRAAVGALTVEDNERLWRANKKSNNWHGHDLYPDFVRLTNYGNGTAFDVELKGQHCLPRVWIGDAPTSTGGNEEPIRRRRSASQCGVKA